MAQSSKFELELVQPVKDEMLQVVIPRRNLFRQILRFSVVGVVNTGIDLLVLNCLLLVFPTQNLTWLVFYNAAAYSIGAFNSFILNKYWTFQRKQATTKVEFVRFLLVNLFGMLCNTSFLWLVAQIAHPFLGNVLLWANFSKVVAISASAIISFLGMRLWVFAAKPQQMQKKGASSAMFSSDTQQKRLSIPPESLSSASTETIKNGFLTSYSLSVILPAYNEEAIIAETVQTVSRQLASWVEDFEILVVNDGSLDSTKMIIEAFAASDTHIHLIDHSTNQGYGAALVSGFLSGTKDLSFFMDADGQFDILDLQRFFPSIGQFDAVLGYRVKRQDTWIRKFNAWGWKLLVLLLLQVYMRDIDCAFKLYRTSFLHAAQLESRGAMINAEILYKLKRNGYTFTEVGVQHLPRSSGKASGANPLVILRAFRELFRCAWKWHRERPSRRA